MTPAPLIHLHGLKKVFLTDEIETHALAGIYLEILPGEYVAIAGPSGCGKSTLLSICHIRSDPRLQHIPPAKSQDRSEEHTSELQSHLNLVCRLLLEKKKKP